MFIVPFVGADHSMQLTSQRAFESGFKIDLRFMDLLYPEEIYQIALKRHLKDFGGLFVTLSCFEDSIQRNKNES